MAETWTIGRMIDWTAEYFERNNIPESRIDAEVLLSHVLDCPRLELYVKKDKELSKNDISKFKAFVIERKNRKPVSYITGEREFMGLKFKVNPHTLIPRPETELLVEEVLKIVENSKAKLVIEIGTGSGNIAVSIAKLSPAVTVYSADSNIETLRVAQANADLNGVSDRVILEHGNLFDAFKGECLEGKADIIVSNPPYVAYSEKGLLAPELLFEPQSALFGGDDGLDFYKAIMCDAGKYLKKGGYIAFEMNSAKSSQIQKIITDAGFKIEKVVNDYSGLERIIIASK